MNTNSFNAGYKTFNITVDAVKYIPSAFCDLGNMVRSDVVHVAGAVTSFFAGVRHAARVRGGKCKSLKCEQEG